VCDQDGDQKVQQMLDRFFPDFLTGPRTIVELALLRRRSFYQPFDRSVDELHEYRLGADPPTEKTSINHSKQYDKNDHSDHSQGKYEKILGPEYLAEQDKFALDQIDQHQRITVDLDEWHKYKKCQVQNRKYDSVLVPFA